MKKKFTSEQIFIGTLLGGPLVGSYLIGRNFKLFGSDQNANISYILGVMLFLGFLIAWPYLTIRYSVVVFDLSVSALFAIFAKFYQLKTTQFAEMSADSYWKVVGAIVVGALVSKGAIAAFDTIAYGNV